MTVVSWWLFDWAFAASPQSGLAWFCFRFPLIEPDNRTGRFRASSCVGEFSAANQAIDGKRTSTFLDLQPCRPPARELHPLKSSAFHGALSRQPRPIRGTFGGITLDASLSQRVTQRQRVD